MQRAEGPAIGVASPIDHESNWSMIKRNSESMSVPCDAQVKSRVGAYIVHSNDRLVARNRSVWLECLTVIRPPVVLGSRGACVFFMPPYACFSYRTGGLCTAVNEARSGSMVLQHHHTCETAPALVRRSKVDIKVLGPL